MNPYTNLKKPGIYGTVSHQREVIHTVYNTNKSSLQVWASQISPAVWDYGYHWHRTDGKTFSKLPGERDGWFETDTRALLYVLGEIKENTPRDSDEWHFINDKIKQLNTQSLFD